MVRGVGGNTECVLQGEDQEETSWEIIKRKGRAATCKERIREETRLLREREAGGRALHQTCSLTVGGGMHHLHHVHRLHTSLCAICTMCTFCTLCFVLLHHSHCLQCTICTLSTLHHFHTVQSQTNVKIPIDVSYVKKNLSGEPNFLQFM